MKKLLSLYFVPQLVMRLLMVALTAGLECGVAWIFKFRKREELWAVACVNVVTGPILHYLFWILPWLQGWMWPLEGLVILLEWGLLCFALRGNAWRLLRLSFVMNLISSVLGIIILDWLAVLFKALAVVIS